MNVDRAKVEALKAAWCEDREARVLWWRQHWHVALFDALIDIGGGIVLGVALGLAALVHVLQGVA